jgi:hypothetical protein
MNISNSKKKKKEKLFNPLSKQERRKFNKQKKKIKKEKYVQKLKLLKERKRIIKETKQDRKIQQKLEKEKHELQLYSKKITGWISEETIQKIAIYSGYIKRIDLKILPMPLLLTLAYGMFGNGESTLTLLSLDMFGWFNINITPQALSDRMSKKETVLFLKNILIEALTQQIVHGLKNTYGHLFDKFTAVQIEDSTQFKLHEKLKGKFKGSGGSASAAAMKLNTVYNITQHTISHLDIVPGVTSDQSLSQNVRKLIKKGELWIRDLGYFNISDMFAINKLKAYFLSRLKKGVSIFLNEKDTESIDIFKFLEENTKDGSFFDKDIYIGEKKNRLKVRIVGEKVPGHVQQKRIENYKKNKIKRDKKKKIKEDYFVWFGYSVFITNVGREIFSFAEVIIAIYKIRWQIEIFFKRIKSILQVDVIKGKSKNRVLCLVYAKLISLLMSQSIMSYALFVCDEEEELSEHKLIQWLKSRLGNAIINNDMESLLVELLQNLHLLSKNKRKMRKSTFRNIKEAFEKDIEEWDQVNIAAM